MDFTVIWQWQAIRQLTRTYEYARDIGRNTDAIVSSMNRIESILKQAPASAGESREEQVRVLIVNPLTAYFEVYEEQKVVLVTSIRYHRRDIGLQ
jgi:tRNA splicing ligase